MNFKRIFAKLLHRHNFATLVIYKPHSHYCDQPQCATNNTWGFMLRCDCGYTKLTELPSSMACVYVVDSKAHKGSEP